MSSGQVQYLHCVLALLVITVLLGTTASAVEVSNCSCYETTTNCSLSYCNCTCSPAEIIQLELESCYGCDVDNQNFHCSLDKYVFNFNNPRPQCRIYFYSSETQSVEQMSTVHITTINSCQSSLFHCMVAPTPPTLANCFNITSTINSCNTSIFMAVPQTPSHIILSITPACFPSLPSSPSSPSHSRAGSSSFLSSSPRHSCACGYSSFSLSSSLPYPCADSVQSATQNIHTAYCIVILLLLLVNVVVYITVFTIRKQRKRKQYSLSDHDNSGLITPTEVRSTTGVLPACEIYSEINPNIAYIPAKELKKSPSEYLEPISIHQPAANSTDCANPLFSAECDYAVIPPRRKPINRDDHEEQGKADVELEQSAVEQQGQPGDEDLPTS